MISETVKKLEQATVLSNLKKYFAGRNDVLNVFVFGSFARGTNTKNSDLDLIIIKNTEERFLERYKSFRDLDDNIGLPIDVLVYTEKEWADVRERKFFKNTAIVSIL